ncbi:MAG: hypothetical protein M9910_08450 [Kiritimatiellae bacterium]|nr:hypothetical protein [Kiritimatiellia bacterium]
MKHAVGTLFFSALCYGVWYVAAFAVDSPWVEKHALWLLKIGAAITSFYAYLGDWISRIIFLNTSIRAFVAVVLLLGAVTYGCLVVALRHFVTKSS